MSENRIIYQDGEFVEASRGRVSPFDDSIRCGFTLYETLLCDLEGRTFRLDSHLERMERSATLLGLGVVPSVDTVRSVSRRLARENGIVTGRLRLMLASREEGVPSSLFITSAPYAPPTRDDLHAGWGAIRAPFIRDRLAPSSGHKCGNFLDVQILKNALSHRTEGILLNEEGRLCEGCFTNLFLVRGGGLMTPSLTEGCLPGVTRATVLEICRRQDIPCEETTLTWEDLGHAREAFITNALMGPVPLTRIDSDPVGTGEPGERTALVRRAYLELVGREWL
ncbi:MAG: aminotransferase class IV [Planctomycetota bacterium]|jgi:branched-subunit amino acid aminotransferase/4-amino-4-deoxychorismate lyase